MCACIVGDKKEEWESGESSRVIEKAQVFDGWEREWRAEATTLFLSNRFSLSCIYFLLGCSSATCGKKKQQLLMGKLLMPKMRINPHQSPSFFILLPFLLPSFVVSE